MPVAVMLEPPLGVVAAAADGRVVADDDDDDDEEEDEDEDEDELAVLLAPMVAIGVYWYRGKVLLFVLQSQRSLSASYPQQKFPLASAVAHRSTGLSSLMASRGNNGSALVADRQRDWGIFYLCRTSGTHLSSSLELCTIHERSRHSTGDRAGLGR